jgi:hypothetical protein
MIPVILFLSLVHDNLTCDQATKIMNNATDLGGNVSNATLQEAIKAFNIMKCDDHKLSAYVQGWNRGTLDYPKGVAYWNDTCTVFEGCSGYKKGYNDAINAQLGYNDSSIFAGREYVTK